MLTSDSVPGPAHASRRTRGTTPRPARARDAHEVVSVGDIEGVATLQVGQEAQLGSSRRIPDIEARPHIAATEHHIGVLEVPVGTQLPHSRAAARASELGDDLHAAGCARARAAHHRGRLLTAFDDELQQQQAILSLCVVDHGIAQEDAGETLPAPSRRQRRISMARFEKE